MADIENGFDCVPYTVLWWAMWKLGIDEWIIQVVKSLYDNAHSKVRITNCYNKPTNVSVSAHQRFVLRQPLFITVMEGVSHEFRIGYLGNYYMPITLSL